jgi:altronate dehydratase large subunit
MSLTQTHRSAPQRSVCDDFLGYPRGSGLTGTRNHVLLLPSTMIVNRLCAVVQSARPRAVCLTHEMDVGVGDRDLNLGALARFAASPNVAAAIIVGAGDDEDPLDELVDEVRNHGGRAHRIAMLDHGGFGRTVEVLLKLVDELQAEADAEPRVRCAASTLVFGTECGGSDAYSGLTANPVVGVCSDAVVAAGGTAILAEFTELIGAEHLLQQRAVTPEIAERLTAAILAWERFALEFGEDLTGENMSPGNIRGGITTIEEKSLGCVRKGGTSTVVDVVGFGERSNRRGLVLMDTDGDDVAELVALTASGANVIAFTTGRGTPAASPVVPTIKIGSNGPLFRRMSSLIDLDAGRVLEGTGTIQSIGDELVRLVGRVASGELTCAERRNQRDFALPPTTATA